MKKRSARRLQESLLHAYAYEVQVLTSTDKAASTWLLATHISYDMDEEIKEKTARQFEDWRAKKFR